MWRAASEDQRRQKNVIILIGRKARTESIQECTAFGNLGHIDCAYLAWCEQEKRILHAVHTSDPVLIASL